MIQTIDVTIVCFIYSRIATSKITNLVGCYCSSLMYAWYSYVLLYTHVNTGTKSSLNRYFWIWSFGQNFPLLSINLSWGWTSHKRLMILAPARWIHLHSEPVGNLANVSPVSTVTVLHKKDDFQYEYSNSSNINLYSILHMSTKVTLDNATILVLSVG